MRVFPSKILATSLAPFGMVMKERSWQATSTDKYRFGMNTQEKDNEIFEGAYSAEYWEYDSRVGRRWNVDPVFKEYESPYACFGNNPIWIVDHNGADSTVYLYSAKGKDGKDVYAKDELDKIVNQSQNVANKNGMSYIKYKSTSLEELKTNTELKLNPYTDLIYCLSPKSYDWAEIIPGITSRELSDGSIYFESIFQGKNFFGGSIFMFELDELQKNAAGKGSNTTVNAGIALAHESITHGYANIIETLFNMGALEDHKNGGLENSFQTAYFGKTYLKLRDSEKVHESTKLKIECLFKFDNGLFANTHEKSLSKYEYSYNGFTNRYFTDVLLYHFSPCIIKK